MQARALKSFRGRPGEGAAGRVRRNTILDVDEHRARALEARGLVVRMVEPAPLNKALLSAPLNKVAPSPLSPAAGPTGPAAPSSSSPAAPRPRRPRSTASAGAALSSSSTMAAGSPPGRTPSTPPTDSGGARETAPVASPASE